MFIFLFCFSCLYPSVCLIQNVSVTSERTALFPKDGMWKERSNKISALITFSILCSPKHASVFRIRFLGVSQCMVVLQISTSPPTAFIFFRQLSPMKTWIFLGFLPHMAQNRHPSRKCRSKTTARFIQSAAQYILQQASHANSKGFCAMSSSSIIWASLISDPATSNLDIQCN